MAATNSTFKSNKASREGATAALAALRRVDEIRQNALTAEHEEESETGSLAQYFKGKDEATMVMLNAAGNPDAFLAGFLAVLVEYVGCAQEGSVLAADNWCPEALMTEKEKSEHRACQKEEIEEDVRLNASQLRPRHELVEQAYELASPLAKKWIQQLPSSVGEYRKNSSRRIERMIEINLDCVRQEGGYSFDKQTLREFDNAMTTAIAVLRNGSVRFEDFTRETEIRRLAQDAFSRSYHSLSLTGHETKALIERVIQEATEAVPA